ncbi:MAG: hypothetical protein M1608_00520 [Candidatus Omnitrophica bacterium]|nr:hypothetical protein [Candidatus Omnitrophota bacterium]
MNTNPNTPSLVHWKSRVLLLLSLPCFLNSSQVIAGDLALELKNVPHRIVYETYAGDNWELFMVNADGSNPINLTQTPQVDELYPHVSPDGTKVCYSADEGRGADKVRNVYYMNLDGSGRTRVAVNARQACWNSTGTQIAYLKGEKSNYNNHEAASKGLFIYDLKTGQYRQHPNRQIEHIFNVCWTRDGKWFVATVYGGMGFGFAIIAIEANSDRVVDLNIRGCRPDLSPDGKRIVWCWDNGNLAVADFDCTTGTPRVLNPRVFVTTAPFWPYNADWSPDGRYVAFANIDEKQDAKLGVYAVYVGARARGANICVADPSQTNRWVAITSDGNSNKEPDWVPTRARATSNSEKK